MFNDKLNQDEFALLLEENLKAQYNIEKTRGQRRVAGAISHLNEAANLLRSVGFEKEAECINHVSKKVEDPATDGLSYEDMVEKLLERGWMFNAADDGHECSEGEEPQLSQEELKRLRMLLNASPND